MSTCDGDSDSDSSEKGTPEILSQSDSTVTIPTSEVDRITFAPFQTYRCYGVDIEFPVNRTPFPSATQCDDISTEIYSRLPIQIIKSLSENENAILESPTGTGKTLALLCSSITWLKMKQEEEARLKQGKNELENQISCQAHIL